ncbi:SDR family NAD(P)-dependent oxidoreductase [Nocardiopsis mangrovi]|uniref:SDR family NAD(P)-dependent oxidoreductase n=1 Tax=Nocardiopsis mangrovi TaxID=1179818 RepID=A0ABV9E3F3_9ACTN
MPPIPSGPAPAAEDRPAGGAPGPDPAELDACLRVLAQARAADPADPRWQAVHRAVAHVHRVGRSARRAARDAERRRRDREAIATSARYRDQDPDPDPGPGPEPGSAGPPAHMLPTVAAPRPCYVCKAPFREVHPEYHLLCAPCAQENLTRRHARCDLRGRRALVTGGRVKIGFHTALKLLRDGAEVIVTTRFPADAARRFAAVPDSAEWLERLHVREVDLLDLPAVAGLLAAVHRRFDHLDILVNNAAQTIRRPPAYHREVREAERLPLTGAAARVDITGAPALPGAGPQAPDTSLTARTVPAATAASAPVAGAPVWEELFPAGRVDETGQPLDLRDRNSWSLRLHEVDPAEWMEVQMVNAFAPFLLTSRLRGLLEASPRPDRYVVQVSAMEGCFSRKGKTVRHPHTNMAKASLNMLTRTAAADYARAGIHMNSVDTGWVTDENPHPVKTAHREAGFRPPLDVIDGAARVYDPIVRGVNGERVSGLFLKDYRPVDW